MPAQAIARQAVVDEIPAVGYQGAVGASLWASCACRILGDGSERREMTIAVTEFKRLDSASLGLYSIVNGA
jgi:hypothetical protein